MRKGYREKENPLVRFMCAIDNAHKSKTGEIQQMKNKQSQRIEEITESTLVVGVDIAKKVHWARFTDYRGKEVGKAVSFKSDRIGFESIVARIELLRKNKMLKKSFNKVVIGMEPTGHYCAHRQCV